MWEFFSLSPKPGCTTENDLAPVTSDFVVRGSNHLKTVSQAFSKSSLLRGNNELGSVLHLTLYQLISVNQCSKNIRASNQALRVLLAKFTVRSIMKQPPDMDRNKTI